MKIEQRIMKVEFGMTGYAPVVMLNSFQHLSTPQILNQVQDDNNIRTKLSNHTLAIIKTAV